MREEQHGRVKSVHSPFPPGAGLSGLVKMLAPAAVHVTYCASNALPFRVDWESPRGLVVFFGLSPDEAANEAALALARGSVLAPARQMLLTEPVADPDWTSAMRDLIADVEADRREARVRPILRVVRGGAG